MTDPSARARPAIPARSASGALWFSRVRIRFSHCDPAGIVYFPRYFDLLNGVVEDWFGEVLGLSYHGFHASRRVGLGYAQARADFFAPGFMGDELDVALAVERIGSASLDLTFTGFRGQTAILRARLTLVTTCLDERRAIPLPSDLRVAVVRYREGAPAHSNPEPVG